MNISKKQLTALISAVVTIVTIIVSMVGGSVSP